MTNLQWIESRLFDDIKYHKADGIAKLTINRPEVRNSFRPQTIVELREAMSDARDDPEIGVIILTGKGRDAFCAGGDQRVRREAGYEDEKGVHRLNVLDLQRDIRTCPKPVVAMVAGYAIGGGHILHLICDLTIAADNARFGQTGPRVGSFDGGYGASYMARIVGQKKAREIWFLCRQYDAQQALDMGLVNTVVPYDRLEEETVQWCREILGNSPLALRCLKSALNADCDGQAGLQELAGNATMLFYMTEEGQEGRNAFLEKRKPDFGRFPPPTVTGAWGVWWQATRPRTLPAAVAPVLVGTGMAYGHGSLHVPSACAAMAGALMLQVGTNYANDYYDFVKGADTDERLGPTRATAAGLVAPETMMRAFVIAFAIAFALGLYLVLRAGWPILVIGIASIACGILYTGGPRPLGYLGLGDITVLVFFGPVAVAGTYYAQTLAFDEVTVVAGIGPGLIAMALLAVNNLRDVDTDRVAGKKTLAVRFGSGVAKAEYVGAIAIATAIPVVLWLGFGESVWGAAASATPLLALSSIGAVLRAEPGDRLQGPLSDTGRLLAVYGLFLAVGCAIGP